MPALLETKDLVVSFGPSAALQGVDIAVPERTVVGVLGPNGAGKSTLLNAIAGLVAPSSGTILLRGDPITGMRANEVARRGVCLIPEGRGILPALTVADNLKLAVSRSALPRVYERFPVLAERTNQPGGTLSGGEQQMLALAHALDDDVELLLVDEPSLGLAPRLVDMVEDTLRYLHGECGVTIVWVEQYAARVLALADIIYVLGRGRVVWAGEPSELEASSVLASTYLGGGKIGDG